MFSTCIFCHSDLGKNEAVEHFPVGRRLAFDATRGRLWVVCRKCERWNLTPLEERWEAIEECERLFRDTRLRVSTDNIGLAKLREGLELVRIGQPQRPEMAAWRYGDQFGRRRNKHLVYTGIGVAAAAGIVILGPATGIIAGSSWGLWNLMTTANSAYQQRRVRSKLVLPDLDRPAPIRLKQLNRVSIVAHEESWALRVPYEVPSGVKPTAVAKSFRMVESKVEVSALLTGGDAIRAAGKLLPAINASGAKKTEVQSAVGLIEEAQSPESLFERYSRTSRKTGYGRKMEVVDGAGHVLSNLPKEVRLALEMATHEESERRALEGELALLEAAWQEAEEIAAISDDMFIGDETRSRLSALKQGDSGSE